jgi:hypothetical protein
MPLISYVLIVRVTEWKSEWVAECVSEWLSAQLTDKSANLIGLISYQLN